MWLGMGSMESILMRSRSRAVQILEHISMVPIDDSTGREVI